MTERGFYALSVVLSERENTRGHDFSRAETSGMKRRGLRVSLMSSENLQEASSRPGAQRRGEIYYRNVRPATLLVRADEINAEIPRCARDDAR